MSANRQGDFPLEPIRTLDALYLATAVVAQGWVGPIQILSLEQRIRDNAVCSASSYSRTSAVNACSGYAKAPTNL